MTAFYRPFIEWATQYRLDVHLPPASTSSLRCTWKDTGLLAILLDVPREASEWPIVIHRLKHDYFRYRSHLHAVRNRWIPGMAPFIWMYNKRPLWGVAYHMGPVPNLLHLWLIGNMCGNGIHDF